MITASVGGVSTLREFSESLPWLPPWAWALAVLVAVGAYVALWFFKAAPPTVRSKRSDQPNE